MADRVQKIGPDEIEAAVATLVLAFSGDPVTRRVFREPPQFLGSFAEVARADATLAVEHGSAWQAGDFGGVALWLPPGTRHPDETMGQMMSRGIDPERQPLVFERLAPLAEIYPREPSWYLPLLGVDPRRQGEGHGTALLDTALEDIDAEGLADPESSNPRNVPLFLRHGFEVLDELEMDAGVILTPMVRPPR